MEADGSLAGGAASRSRATLTISGNIRRAAKSDRSRNERRREPQVVGHWPTRRGRTPVRGGDFIAAASGGRAAGLSVRDLSRRRRRICDPGGDASPAVGISPAGLVWQGAAAVALVQVATAWAVITGGLLLAAAHRLFVSEGRWILVLARVVSASWGALLAVIGAGDTRTMGPWLIAYAVIFGGTLVVLAGHWQRQRYTSAGSAADGS
jgi:hypothetical protein